jgi:hypothetical protein
LVVEQFPSGFTRHQLLAAADGQNLNPGLLHEFTGNTSGLQTLAFDFDISNRDFRYIRVATVQSPSWVAWREIRFIKEGSTSVHYLENKYSAGANIYPNAATNTITIETNSGWPGEMIINISNLDGDLILHGKVQNQEKTVVDVSALPPGMYFVEIRTVAGRVTKKLVIQ